MVKKIRKKTTGKSRTARTQASKPVQTTTRQKDPFGFIEGTDSSIAAYALHEGGTDRMEIYERIRERIKNDTTAGLITRKGTEKNIPNLAATVVKQMRARGWIVESTWRMVKDPSFTEEPEVQEPAPEPAEAPRKRRKARKASTDT